MSKKKQNEWGLRILPVPILIIGLIISIGLGAVLSAPIHKDMTIFTYIDELSSIMEGNIAIEKLWNGKYTLIMSGCMILVYIVIVLLYMCSGRNYMHGQEYGTAKYANPDAVSRKLTAPPDKNNPAVKYFDKGVYVDTRNRRISQNLQMSLDTRLTDLNNNILVDGGSGAGKTFRFVGPQIMQMSSSFIVTDPKGEIARKYSPFLEAHGYDVKVLNLLNETGMKKSTRYNPFKYIRSDTDIVKLVTNFFENTKKKGATSGDQFWDDMAGLLLQAFFYYTRDVGVEIEGRMHHDMRGVMHLVNMAKIEEDPQTGARTESELDLLFRELEEENPNHLAVISYNKATVGAADTVRSIISSLNSRTTSLQTDVILDLLSEDEIDIPNIGARKTALFCIIPDNDKTYNFLIGMLYSQIFQELYYQADFVYGGQLPVHVTFMMDEFANVALPDDFCSLLSTMRSREISSIIIIQNLAQLKALFEKTYESIIGNCDTFIYLGGNEKETHKYISESLGKKTIDKKSSGLSKGRNGNYSENFDVLGRELMMPEEVRKLSRKQCVVFISGYDPIVDDKVHTLELPYWKEVCKLSKTYNFDARLKRAAAKRQEGGIKFFKEDDIRKLMADDRMVQEEYETQCRIAELEGKEKPQKPEKKVIEADLKAILLTETMQEEITFDEETLINNRNRISEEDRQIKEINEKALELSLAGYDSGQVEILREILPFCSVKEIETSFSPEMSADLIKYLAEDLYGEFKQQVHVS